MAITGEISPFTGELIEEIPLASAPLLRVLCQVRWPNVTRLDGDFDAVAQQMGSLLADDFPLSQEHQELEFKISPQGVEQQTGDKVYQWSSADEAWSLSFSRNFLTLQSDKYTSRTDFFSRFLSCLEVLEKVVKIPLVDRIGFRYVNRISEPLDMELLPELVTSDVSGVKSHEDGVTLVHTVSETLYEVVDLQLMVRAARLPAGGRLDPTLAPVPEESWNLDLDASFNRRMPFSAIEVRDTGLRLSSLAYAYFRSVIQDKFVEHFTKERS